MAIIRSGKLLAATLCIVVALFIVTPVSAQQYGYGFSGSGTGNFNPLAYFRPIASGISPGFPVFGVDPFNPFVYGSVWNPVSFLGPRNIGTPGYPANVGNQSKGNETESKGNETERKGNEKTITPDLKISLT